MGFEDCGDQGPLMTGLNSGSHVSDNSVAGWKSATLLMSLSKVGPTGNMHKQLLTNILLTLGPDPDSLVLHTGFLEL